MTETSFPVVEKPLTEDQWGTIASSFGQGIIDMGGHPYRLVSRDDVTDTATIDVDTITGKNEAIIRGFVHSINEPKVLSLPPVASTTTYEIGLVYDPLGHGTDAGPVTLEVWTAPGDYTSGKARLVLYRVTRQPSQALSMASVQEYRQRVAPLIAVTSFSHLPKVETMLTDTVAFVRATGAWYRVANNGASAMEWVEIGNNLPPTATEALANTIALRDGASRLKSAAPGTGSTDVVTRGWFDDQIDDYVPASEFSAGDTTKANMRRWGSGVGPYVLDPDHNLAVANKQYVDRKTWQASDITSGTFHGLRVSHSQWAYDRGQTGTVYTVSVNSNGMLMRFTSRRADKDNIEDLDLDPRRVLAVNLVRFKRRDPVTGQVPEGARWEWGVIADDELAREDGVPELVLTEPDEDGVEQPEGWDQQGHVTALHRVAQWSAARQDAMRADLDAIAEHLGIELPSRKGEL